MKERPILFNTAMVKAILEGRKTQTRRVVNPQPEGTTLKCLLNGKWLSKNFNGLALPQIEDLPTHSPFGQIGDLLWVRETFCYGCIDEWDAEHPDDRKLFVDQYDGRKQAPIPKQWCLENNVEIDDVIWTPSIHMPRSASRILLEITNVRVERLQNITKEDAKAEGFDYSTHSSAIEMGYAIGARTNFRFNWEEMYGQSLWNKNPWVWVVEFKVIQGGNHD